MSTPSDQQSDTSKQADATGQKPGAFLLDESSLQQTLNLVEQSLNGPQAMLVIPDQAGRPRIIGTEQLDLTDVCRERLIAAIEGSDIPAGLIDDAELSNTIISDVLILEPDEPRIRWMATGIQPSGALVICAPEPWESDERDQALLLGFARLLDQQQASAHDPTVASDERLRDLIVESARDGVIGVDIDGRCRYVNQTAAELVGSDPDDLINAPASDLFSLPEIFEGGAFLQFPDDGIAEYPDAVLLRSDGEKLPVELSILPHRDHAGRLGGAVLRFADLRDQRAAVAAVEHSEAWRQAFMEMTLDSFVSVDQAGRIREFNLAAEKTFRCLAEDVLGRDIAETLISPSWRDWWNAAFQRFTESGDGPLSGQRVEMTAMQSDGTEIPTDFTLTRIPAQDGWVYSLSIHDLSEEKWNERRRNTRYNVTHILAETESPRAALPLVLEAICNGLGWDWAACWARKPGLDEMVIDLTWQSDAVDAWPLESASRGKAFTPGYGFLGAVWRNQQSEWIEDLAETDAYRRAEEALACGFRSMLAMPIIGRTEVMGVIELHSRRQRERDPELLRMMNSLGSQIGQFIERKQVEEERVQLLSREQTARAEAENAERRLAFLAEASAQLSTSLDYEVTLANVARLAVPRLADYCAIDMVDDDNQIRSLEIADIDPEKEALGRQLQQDHPVDPESNHPVAQVLRTGRPILFSDVDDNVLRLFAEDDDGYLRALREMGVDSSMYVPLIARGRSFGVVSFVASESGQRYGASDLALAQELTRRAALAIDNARLYREAQDAVRIREEFLSIASHELKTPLTTVKGYGQIISRLLRRPAVDTERLVRLTDQLQEQLARFETLIADLLDVSRIQQRGLELRPEPTDLVALTRTVVSRFEYPIEPEHRHTFTIVAPERLDGVWDPDRLDQVLTNLVSNAVKYSPDGGEIAVTLVLQDDDQVEFAIADQGIGIPETEQGQLFRPFARSETVQRAISGVGLGLYISRQIVVRHGGSIWLESAPGAGSRFTVRLPRYFSAADEPSGPAVSDESSSDAQA